LRNKLGLTRVRLNDLRHRLGHDPAVTQQVYAEFIAENDRTAATSIEDLLDGHRN
jgi:hypothetical protein